MIRCSLLRRKLTKRIYALWGHKLKELHPRPLTAFLRYGNETLRGNTKAESNSIEQVQNNGLYLIYGARFRSYTWALHEARM